MLENLKNVDLEMAAPKENVWWIDIVNSKRKMKERFIDLARRYFIILFYILFNVQLCLIAWTSRVEYYS